MKASGDENPTISVAYCTGYVDKSNQWRPGFNCSGQTIKQFNSTPLFCCGTNFHKYCCSTKQYIQMGYASGHSNDVTYGTLLTVVLSTFIFSVMLTIIAFVCCKRFWKSRENLNLELVDDQLYRNTNFLTLNATQLINANAYGGTNGLQVQSSDAIQCQQLTPTSSINALPQQTLLSPPSITTSNDLANNSNLNSNLPITSSGILTSTMNSIQSPIVSNQTGQQLNNLYTTTNATTTYTINHQNAMAQPCNTLNTTSINTLDGQQSSIAMSGYSVHHPQALQQALILCYEPPPPYSRRTSPNPHHHNQDIHRAFPINNSNEIAHNNLQHTQNENSNLSTAILTIANSNLNSTTSNIDLNTINLINSNASNLNQASASYQTTTDDSRSSNTNNLPTNIWSERLLLALGNYRRDCVYPVLDQPKRKKLCRTLSQ